MKLSLRLSVLIAVAGSVVSGGILFWASQAVQTAEAEQRRLQDAVAGERETIRVLQAEWAYLTRPDRLEELARQHLHMETPEISQLYAAGEGLSLPAPPGLPPRKPVMRAQEAVFGETPARPPAPAAPSAPSAPAEREADFRDLLKGISKSGERVP